MAVALTPNARWDRSSTGIDFPFTWCAWFRLDAFPADFAAVAWLGSVSYSDHLGVFVHQGTGRVSVWDNTFTNRAESEPISVGAWMFFAVAVDAAGDILLGWRREHETELTTATGTYAGAGLSDDFFYLGSDRNTPDFAHTVQGAFAFARLFDGAALDETDLMAESRSPVALNPVGTGGGDYPLDETGGLDVSGNANDLVLEEDTGSAALTAGPVIGLPMPSPLRLRAQMAFGHPPDSDPAGWTWTTLVGRVLTQSPPTVRHGRADESSTTNPGQVTILCRNHDGHMTTDNPLSPWWPHVDEGTPLRLQVETADGWVTRGTFETVAVKARWPHGDIDGLAQVEITAAGVLRRMGQGQPPLHSAMRRLVMAPTNDPHRIAYWPGEDARGSGWLMSPMAGVAPMNPGQEGALEGDDSHPGAGALLRYSGPVGWNGRVPDHGPVSGWRVDWSAKITTPPDFNFPLNGLATVGRAREWVVLVEETQVVIAAWDSSRAGVVFSNRPPSDGMWDHWCLWSLFVRQQGALTRWTLSWVPLEGPEQGLAFSFTGTYSGNSGRVTRVMNLAPAAPQGGLSIGQFIVTTGTTLGWLAPSDTGWTGEAAADRFLRLCDEEGIQGRIEGDTDRSPPMGRQDPRPALDLLQETADVSGVLLEDLDRPGLVLRTNQSKHNQPPAMTVPAVALAVPFEPSKDDQGRRNVVEATRPHGSSVIMEDRGHYEQRGAYRHAIGRNVHEDGQLRHHASWERAGGVWPGQRYPTIQLDLTHPDAVDLVPEWLQVRPGDRVVVTGVPTEHYGTASVIVEGWAETFGDTWTVALNASPGGLWEVATYGAAGAPGRGRLLSSGSALAAGIDATETELVVEVLEGPWWTTKEDRWPVPIMIGPARLAGEVVSATEIGDPVGDDPMRGDGDQDTSPSTSHVAPSVDAPGPADLLLAAACSYLEPGTYTVPGSMAERASTTGEFSTFVDASVVLTSSGATGPRTFTLDTADRWATVAVVAHGASVAATADGITTDGAGGAGGVSLTVPATEGDWIVTFQGWDWDPGSVMGAPQVRRDGIWLSQDMWRLLADSGGGAGSASVSRVMAWGRRVTDTGDHELVFGTQDDLYDNHARVWLLSGVTERSQTFTVVRSVNGIARSWPVGTPIQVADRARYASPGRHPHHAAHP